MKTDFQKLVREYGSEENVAQRISEEMQKRGWSQARLAKEMAANGYPIHQSAISKIVSPPAGDGRRSVSVGEALGFAKTFGVDLATLLIPGPLLSIQRASTLLTEGVDARRALALSRSTYQRIVHELGTLALEDAEVRGTIITVFDAAVKDKSPEEAKDSIQATFLLDVINFLAENRTDDDGQ